MKKTFVDVMLELPVDATLRDFLTSHGLPVPNGFAWDDHGCKKAETLVFTRRFGLLRTTSDSVLVSREIELFSGIRMVEAFLNFEF